MKRKAWLSPVIYILFISPAFSQAVAIHFSASSPQEAYAAGQLRETLIKKGYSVRESPADYEISLSVNAKQLGTEAFSVLAAGKRIMITGGDERGLIYGSLSLTEDLDNGIPLQHCKAKSEKPKLPFRAIKFDLPWDTYRHSYALDLHDQTCRDTSFWKAFLDMMVANRFNSLSLWNLHPYTFMIKPGNFPEASPFPDEELKEWQRLFHTIFRMARERAIDTYVVPFNIFVTPEFAKAHRVAIDNLQHDFFVRGDTSEIIKRYTRECVTQLLNEYPDLSGIGLTLGEGMGGMTPQQREDWIKETVIEGMRLASRKSRLIHRIPFSANTESLGPTSIETEQLTRKAIEEEADLGFTEGPVWADLKFNWSHAHSTTQLIKVHGGKLYDTYFKPEPTKYKITWTARNEDFFCLRWGVPGFIRRHIIQNTHSYVGGYFIGSETYIPAKDYFTKDSTALPWKYAFERQWLFYKLWGRLLYDPATPDDVFRAAFIRRYGKQGNNLLEASALAGATPLRLASDFDLGWDFTLYSEGMMALDTKTKRVDYISADRLINQPPLDTDYISIANYVNKISSGRSFAKSKVTPPLLAGMLEKDCQKALALVKSINTTTDKALVYEVADIRTWAFLGLHLAEKLRGAVALQTYRLKGGEKNKQMAISHFEKALHYWDEVISITRPLYNDMPLVHYSEQDGKSWKENYGLRFHWEKLRPAVAKDIETAQKAVVTKN
ncbi:MAG: glycoside hydrolase family 20 zincin-like fold domain-containing protein [Bacteroidota bacterium]|nr:glycoside hydrolase family 20 zincin-like fold domain-containing protein [Bacteroidota bacterium]